MLIHIKTYCNITDFTQWEVNAPLLLQGIAQGIKFLEIWGQKLTTHTKYSFREKIGGKYFPIWGQILPV